MSEETYTFEKARVRLEEIAAQVRRKDVSLEKSLDLLEEGVRLANLCTERIDHTQWRAAVAEMESEAVAEESASAEETGEAVVEMDAEARETPLADVDAETCEAPPAGADAEGDVPSEDAHAAAAEAAGEGEPDTEA